MVFCLSCDRSHWSNQIDFFSRDHTVVALDLPGHGESGMERPGWPLAGYGKDVKAVIESLGLERVVLVGHSMGGPVALETARLIPDRVLGVVGVDTLQDAESKRLDPVQAKEILAAFEADFFGTCDGFVRNRRGTLRCLTSAARPDHRFRGPAARGSPR